MKSLREIKKRVSTGEGTYGGSLANEQTNWIIRRGRWTGLSSERAEEKLCQGRESRGKKQRGGLWPQARDCMLSSEAAVFLFGAGVQATTPTLASGTPYHTAPWPLWKWDILGQGRTMRRSIGGAILSSSSWPEEKA